LDLGLSGRTALVFGASSGLGLASAEAIAAEGANITLVGDYTIQTPGDYGEEGFVYQALTPIPVFDGNYAVIGSWLVDGVACGMGIRESDGPITDNVSRFVPHMFR
jgi:glutathionylspermidine synthase